MRPGHLRRRVPLRSWHGICRSSPTAANRGVRRTPPRPRPALRPGSGREARHGRAVRPPPAGPLRGHRRRRMVPLHLGTGHGGLGGRGSRGRRLRHPRSAARRRPAASASRRADGGLQPGRDRPRPPALVRAARPGRRLSTRRSRLRRRPRPGRPGFAPASRRGVRDGARARHAAGLAIRQRRPGDDCAAPGGRAGNGRSPRLPGSPGRRSPDDAGRRGRGRGIPGVGGRWSVARYPPLAPRAAVRAPGGQPDGDRPPLPGPGPDSGSGLGRC